MAKVIKYGDTSKIESDFKQAPVGLYTLHCESIEQKKSKNNDEDMVEVVFTPIKDANGKKLKERYGRIWFYAPLDPESSWARRLKDLVTAFGLKPKAGNLGIIEGKDCLGRLREDTDQDGNYRPNIGKLLPLKAEEPEEEEDEEETSEDGELDEMSRTELKAYIKENELDVKVLKSMSDDDIRAAIEELEDEEEDEDEEEEDEDTEDEEDEEEAEGDNYEDMNIKELRQELTDRELETKGKRTVLIARLRTDDVEEPV